MRVRFADKDAALVETDQAHQSGLPVAVIVSARRKLQYLRAAKDERDLRNWKSLRLEKLKGTRQGERSVRLNDQWRIVFRIDQSCDPNEITVLGINDYHK